VLANGVARPSKSHTTHVLVLMVTQFILYKVLSYASIGISILSKCKSFTNESNTISLEVQKSWSESC